MAVRAVRAAAAIALALAACGFEGDAEAPATTRSTVSTVLPPIRTTPTTVRATATKLTRTESCGRFYAIVGDLKLNDDQSADAFSDLARQTADPSLAAAIQRVADGFARHASAISSVDVQALCR